MEKRIYLLLTLLWICGCNSYYVYGPFTLREGEKIENRYDLKSSKENFVLIVSNQSSRPDPAHIIISIDGTEVIDDKYFFNTGRGTPGHSFRSHYFKISSGKHIITAKTIDGKFVFTKEIDFENKKWFLIMFWGDEFTSDEAVEPMYFM